MKQIIRLTFFLIPLLATLKVHAQGDPGVFLTFTTPTPNQLWSNDVFTVTGTCYVTNTSFNQQPLALFVTADDFSSYTMATTFNNYLNWTAQVDLIPGTNTILVLVESDPTNAVLLGTYGINMVYISPSTNIWLNTPVFSNGMVVLNFTVTNLINASYHLLQSTPPDAEAWTTNATAIFTTNILNSSYRFTTTSSAAPQFYRIRSP